MSDKITQYSNVKQISKLASIMMAITVAGVIVCSLLVGNENFGLKTLKPVFVSLIIMCIIVNILNLILLLKNRVSWHTTAGYFIISIGIILYSYAAVWASGY